MLVQIAYSMRLLRGIVQRGYSTWLNANRDRKAAEYALEILTGLDVSLLQKCSGSSYKTITLAAAQVYFCLSPGGSNFVSSPA